METKSATIVPQGGMLVMILGGLEICLIMAAGYLLSQLVGTKDTGNDLMKSVLPVTGTLGGIVLLHTALWYMYSIQFPLSMNLYFQLAISFSMLISLTALSIALVNRS